MADTEASADVLVDRQALVTVAGALKTSAATIGAHAKQVQPGAFAAAQAGRGYAEQGSGIHGGLVRLESWLLQWREASEALADALGSSVVVLGETDAEAARKTASA
ncbi:hypothetical protein NDR87_19320 [Nocardia sp. CDC159]|uniref:Excreted virulence factor EspC (Type VII ESX diderm) n=1 Tax=Nocardia pulmonis TaxID=2951408 RepID=A0A9X2E8B3_9NOCA|nr:MULTISPECIES: hypothetical protein [Nocardia]MCM6776157.1 hypothetical protein [Nocardia pulmonis]MCM6788516.1 hypothetical protein [Nocardia sp. CDC159]